jgi:predicted phage-related endonuclease
MATYRQIHTHIWDDPDFEELSADARLIFIWAFSNRHRNEACLYTITVKKISNETGLSTVKTKQALQELVKAEMIGYDFDEQIMWVKNALKYQTINPNCLRAVKKDLESIGRHYLVKDFIEHYSCFLAAHETIWKPLINGLEMVQEPSINNNSNNNNIKEEEGGMGEEETIPLQIPFDRFWAAYPKKRAKGDAEKTWHVLKPSEPLVIQIIATLELAKTSDEWQKDSGQYIPYPATWLRRKGWEDEYDNKKEARGNGRVRTSTDDDTEFAGVYE